MAPIQVLITGMPQLLADIVRGTIRQHPDLRLLEESCGAEDLLRADRPEIPDVLIVGLEGTAIPAFCGPLLYGNPGLKVLAVSVTGEGTALYELRPHRVAIGNVTPDGLVDAIRGSCRARAVGGAGLE